MWIELIVAVCLHTAPTDCREMHFQIIESSLGGCMANAQPYMARWVNDHPQWRIVRWKCSAGDTGGQEI